MDDAVVKLEHTYGDDRMKRIMFSSMESLIIWQKVAWLHLISIALVILLPGILLMIFSDELKILGDVLAGLGLLLILWFAYCGKTTIRMTRRGTVTDISGVFRPGKVRKFRDKVLEAVRRVQGDSAAV